jgi:hypothetical protein
MISTHEKSASEGPWYCTCLSPRLGNWNECQACHRKPKAVSGLLRPYIGLSYGEFDAGRPI